MERQVISQRGSSSRKSSVTVDKSQISPLLLYIHRKILHAIYACVCVSVCVCTCVRVWCAHPRFTELYVDELENEGDLRILVSDYLKGLTLQRSVISGIIR